MTLRLQSTNGPATGAPINNRSRSGDVSNISRGYTSQGSFDPTADDSSDEEQQYDEGQDMEL